MNKILPVIAAICYTLTLIMVQMVHSEDISVYNYNTGQYEYLDIEPNDKGLSVYNFSTDEFSDAERVDVDKHQGYDYNSGAFKDYTDKGNGEIETYNYSTGEYQTLEVIK